MRGRERSEEILVGWSSCGSGAATGVSGLHGAARDHPSLLRSREP